MEKNKKNNIEAFLSGVFVATAIGGYFLFGSKNARKNRQKIDNWIENAQEDVMTQIKKIKKISKDKYYEIVDEISDKYSKLKEVGKEKADELRLELKSKWEQIEKEAHEEYGDK